jgi:hypothetical protein
LLTYFIKLLLFTTDLKPEADCDCETFEKTIEDDNGSYELIFVLLGSLCFEYDSIMSGYKIVFDSNQITSFYRCTDSNPINIDDGVLFRIDTIHKSNVVTGSIDITGGLDNLDYIIDIDESLLTELDYDCYAFYLYFSNK